VFFGLKIETRIANFKTISIGFVVIKNFLTVGKTRFIKIRRKWTVGKEIVM